MPSENWASAVREKHELQQQLDAANQRIEKLEGALQSAVNSAIRRKRRAEAAERKLATARATVAKIAYRQCDEHGCKWRAGCFSCAEAKSHNTHLDSAIKALAQIEPPQQQLSGEDPPFDMCQCPACVAFRETRLAERQYSTPRKAQE